MIYKIVQASVREPLVHFLLLGTLLFIADALVSPASEPPNLIVVDDSRIAPLIELFVQARQREPNSDELATLILSWTKNDMLVREGIALGLDRNDGVIRNRIAEKMMDLMASSVIQKVPDELELAAFFQEHRKKYDQPALYDLEQIALQDVTSRQQAESLVRQKADLEPLLESTFRYLRKPESDLANFYGNDDTQRLIAGEAADWLAVDASTGWYLVRIVKVYPAEHAVLEHIKDKVVLDWQQQRRDQQMVQQGVNLAEKFQWQLDVSAEFQQKWDIPTELVRDFSGKFRQFLATTEQQ